MLRQRFRVASRRFRRASGVLHTGGMYREDSLSDEAYQIREVFALYGRVMYSAQALEAELANVLVLNSIVNDEFRSLDDFDIAYERHFAATLGRLLQRLADGTAIDAAARTVLSDALVTRNRFAHRFFDEHVENFLTTPGREEMLADCLASELVIEQACKTLRTLQQQQIASSPLDAEKLEQHATEFRESVRKRLPDEGNVMRSVGGRGGYRV